MMRRMVIALFLLGTLVLGGVAVAGAADGGATAVGDIDREASSATVPMTIAKEPDASARQMARELDELASAWAAAGGTYGYPFWAKAQERWRAGEISASLFREYVSGYRDRIRMGCQLVDDVTTGDGVASDTHELVSDACAQRVKGLAAQQRWLDLLIAMPVLAAASVAGADAEAEAEADAEAAAAERDAELAKREAEAQEALQRSFRDTRRALDLAQAELDAQGLERLHEDAFM